MLRDSLTGLPNRTAFNERVEAVLEDPGFLPGSHAVLVLDMTRFSRVNECVGALAGDEIADHLRPPPGFGACAPATSWRAPAATSSAY